MVNLRYFLKFFFFISILSSSVQIINYSDSVRIIANIVKILPLFLAYILIFLSNISIKKRIFLPSILITIICFSRYLAPNIETSAIEFFGGYQKDTNIINPQIINQIIFAFSIPIMYLIKPSINEKKKAYYWWVILSVLITLLCFYFPDYFTFIHNGDWGITSGLVGNPNSFSLLCYLIILDIISWREKPKFFIQQIFILFVLASITGSLMSILFGFFTLVYIAYYLLFNTSIIYKLFNFETSTILNLILIVIIVSLIYSNIEFLLDLFNIDKVYLKFQSLLEFKGGASINIRKDYYNYTFNLIRENPLCLITGFCKNKYLTGDGYIPTLLASFGIPISFIYIWSYMRILKIFRPNNFPSKKVIIMRTKSYFLTPYSFSIILITLSLITSRLLDYWPFTPLALYILSSNNNFENDY